MSSRPDIPLVLLVLGSVLGVSAYLGNPSGYSQSTAAEVPVGTVVAIFLYAFFWGLVVRRGMAVRLYRNQALGMSLVSFGFLSIFLTIILGSALSILGTQVSYTFRFGLYGFLLFFWVDASMRASQDMDPLSRDSLRWSKLRYILWGLSFTGMGVFLGFLALTGNYGFFENPPSGLTPTAVLLLSDMPFLVPSVAGIVALPIGALRSKDRTFRRQLQWFALALLLLLMLLFFVLYALYTGGASQAPTFAVLLFLEIFLATGYCFYRSTRALVPLSRISPD